MEESMRNTTFSSSKSRNMACYSHLSSLIDSAIPKLTILPPSLKLSLTVRFAKNRRLHMIRGSEQRTTTTTTTSIKKKKKKKQRSWIKPINRLARRISSMIYTSFGIKKSSHWVDDDDDEEEEEEGDDVAVEEDEEERGEREKDDESLEYLMYKLSLALDGTTSSRYIPLMELLKQMRGGGRFGRERNMGMRFHMFSSRRRRRRNRGRTIGKVIKKIKDKETVQDDDDDDDKEWGNGDQLCNRRILMGWRCRPIKDDDDHDIDDHHGVFLSDY